MDQGQPRLRHFLMLFGLFRTAVADWNPIPSGSMHPNLLEGDVVLVNRLAWRQVPLTDVVLAHTGETASGVTSLRSRPAMARASSKRLVALPGDVVEMHANRLTINGQPAQYQDRGVATEQVDDHARLTAQHAGNCAGYHARCAVAAPGAGERSNFGPVTVPARPVPDAG